MPYKLTSSDSDSISALRRIACEQLDRALAATDDPGELHEGVHDARKRCKKVRGLIRLVRPAFPDYRAENAALRDAARHLAPLRERGAGLETLDRLEDIRGEEIGPEALGEIRAGLERRAREARLPDLAARLAAFRADLGACRDRTESWGLEKDGFAAVKGGLKKTFKRARKQMKKARRSHDAKDMHEWRKRVKYHWYHARLLKTVKPGKLKPRIRRAKELSEILGDHHDLVDLRDLLDDGTLPGDATAVLRPVVLAEMERLEKAAFDLGPDLLDTKPKKLARKLKRGWPIW